LVLICSTHQVYYWCGFHNEFTTIITLVRKKIVSQQLRDMYRFPDTSRKIEEAWAFSSKR